MNRLFKHIRLPLLLLSLSLLSPVALRGAITFPESSELASGKWVKINFTRTGVYEISYDKLREMGFANPEKVGVFGHGGTIQPMQFVSKQGAQLYSSQLSPVAMFHAGDKIIFFGQGPEQITQLIKNASRPEAEQLSRAGYNNYASCGSYFLTDTRSDMLIPKEASSWMNTQLPFYTNCWVINYHEIEKTCPMNKGREYFGENLKGGTLSFPYSLPGAQAGDAVSFTVRPAHYSTSDASLNVELKSADKSEKHVMTVQKRNNGDYYSSPAVSNFATTLPGPEGTIELTYSGTSSWAYLDYFLLASKSKLTFTQGAGSVMGYANDFDPNKYTAIKIYDTPADMIVWDILTPSDVKKLPWVTSGANANVRYHRSGKEQGLLVAFSPSAAQWQIDSWSDVKCENLHKIGLDGVPDLLIITLPAFKAQAERIAKLHERVEGLKTEIVFSDDVVDEFSAGVPDPMAYRALAKMIYDRDDPQNRKFKNILLLGPALRDNRGVETDLPYGTLICNQSFQGQNVDESFTLNDWYGMMNDYTTFTPEDAAAHFATLPLEIGVGNIPATSPADADAYIDKLEAFYADDSYAYWLNTGNFIADSANDNLHQNQMDALHHDVMDNSRESFAGNKIYNNLYSYKGTTAAFCRRLEEGALYNYYLGHADTSGLNAEFWTANDEPKLKNERLPIMLIGGCTITEFDMNVRGSGERLVFLPKHGLMGGIMTTRSGYSYSNFLTLQCFEEAMLLDDPTDEQSPLLSHPRTLGEIYAIGKTNYNSNANSLAYVLIGDPAVTLPLPTADVVLSINGKTAEEVDVKAGEALDFNGTITDRAGQLLSDFNGTLVVKVYDAPVSVPTIPRTGAEVVQIELDEAPVSVVSVEVTAGRFSGSVLIPSTLTACAEPEATLRLAAFDATSRRAAASAVKMAVREYDPSAPGMTDNPPVIEEFYPISPEHPEGEPLPSDFTLYADVTDDHGVMTYDINSLPAMLLTLDGRSERSDFERKLTFSEGGRRCKVAYDVKGLTPGLHTLSLTVHDAEGQRDSRSITVNIGESNIKASLQVEDKPVSTSALFTLTAEGDSTPDNTKAIIVILDALGNEVLTAPVNNGEYEWNICDAQGERVPAGPYSAVCRLSNAALGQGVTEAVKVIVF